ncbi:MAG TPA: CPBP family intramembrane glutamic endopeptidase [Cyclobacteriaceae bacterium]
MEHNGNELALQNSRKPALSFMLVLFFSFVGFTTLGPFLGILFALPFPGFDLNNLLSILENPVKFPESKTPFLIIQGISSVVGFIVLPSIFLVGIQKMGFRIFFQAKTVTPVVIFVTILFIILFMVVNSVFVEWNANLKLPEFMSGFENWARGLEDNAAVLTQFLTDFDNIGQFLIAFVVIAIIPAFGEEFVFRGLLQNYAIGFLRNPHVAIWVTAILFSGFHLQFFGFVPRAFLGVAFGYLYFWSGNLTIPIIAHFINNGFTLLMIYMYRTDAIGFDIETTESPGVLTVIPMAFITATLLYFFHKHTFQIRKQHGDMANRV